MAAIGVTLYPGLPPEHGNHQLHLRHGLRLHRHGYPGLRDHLDGNGYRCRCNGNGGNSATCSVVGSRMLLATQAVDSSWLSGAGTGDVIKPLKVDGIYAAGPVYLLRTLRG